jgi:hypothetical protein
MFFFIRFFILSIFLLIFITIFIFQKQENNNINEISLDKSLFIYLLNLSSIYAVYNVIHNLQSSY